MSSEKHMLTVMYFVIPLIVVTTFLPLFANQFLQEDMATQYRPNALLYPKAIQRSMGMMSVPDPVLADYDAVMNVLDEIPSAYIQLSTAVGSAATIQMFKNFLTNTDRAHVAAHGTWDNTPVVILSNGDLKKSVVDYWTTQGRRCKLVILSACNSMGHDGIQSNLLAAAIVGKSGIEQVIGYKDEVCAAGAGLFAAFFWACHLWANEQDGGVGSNSAYDDARDNLHQLVCDIADEAMWLSMMLGLITGFILGVLTVLFPQVVPWIWGVIVPFLISYYVGVTFTAYKNSINSAYYGVAKYGVNVPGLTYWGGGGGGGDLPF